MEGDLLSVITLTPHPHPVSPGPGRGPQHFLSMPPMYSHRHTEASSIPDEETEAQPRPGLKRTESASNSSPRALSSTVLWHLYRSLPQLGEHVGLWGTARATLSGSRQPLSSPFPPIQSKARPGNWERVALFLLCQLPHGQNRPCSPSVR